ncbi:hypothetical protein ASPSYDRAFT_68817 [Aspergillus sydowii CBS 593.65]|uniref:Uncharacterized protein n=1 Tax=Aspergillus sydowii CBS 593.65 TaxID=1036612 RepID=A0A1L9TI10_9EURO|nr:uncharacterized protein ASPSYDRAFT_68817 [Aspergillus sydowii CBS 593.65]OJJ59067.1 hypothetical protein ASPSYDRAFT_68817 [Aspergillus sydowii CBS 593.65]
MATKSESLLMTAEFLVQVQQRLAETDNNRTQVYIYADLESELGKAVMRLLRDRVIKLRRLRLNYNSPFAGFTAPYQDSAKAPDVFIRPKGMRLQTIVIQTGWPEATPMFDGRQGDMGIAGAPQTTKLILLVVWKKFVNRTLEAALMAYRPGKPCGAYSIFPAPEAGSAAGDILVSRDELFGDGIPATTNLP